jgi:hypothetical protein
VVSTSTRAEPLGQLGAVPPGIEPEHADLAAVRRAQPFDAFHGRGLARAVGAEDPEDLALVDGERDIVDRRRVPVALVQVLHVDDCWHTFSVATPAPGRHRTASQTSPAAG